MIGYIYKVTSKLNGKIYIGKHNKTYFDTDYYGSGTYIRRSVNKHGKENFDLEMIDTYETQDECHDKERYYIKLYNSNDNSIGYNISSGGEWGDISKGLSPEDRAKWIERMSKSRKGLRQSKEERLKRSKMYSGEGNPQYGKKGTNLGKKFDKEWCNNISKSLKGRKKGSHSMKFVTMFIDDKEVACIRGTEGALRFVKSIGIPRQLFLDSLKDECNIGELKYTKGKNQFTIIRDEKQHLFANYKFVKKTIPR